MSRRNRAKKRFPLPDKVYTSYLVSLLILRILEHGKKRLAERLVKETFEIIENKTESSALFVLERAVKNVSPQVQLKSRRIGGSTYQVPVEVSSYRAVSLAIKWIIEFAKKRPGRTFASKLANEIIDASKMTGNAIRKRDETHRMAKANKAFAHFKY